MTCLYGGVEDGFGLWRRSRPRGGAPDLGASVAPNGIRERLWGRAGGADGDKAAGMEEGGRRIGRALEGGGGGIKDRKARSSAGHYADAGVVPA